MSIAFALLSGAVAGAIAFMIAGNPKEDRNKFGISFVITFGVIFMLSKVFFLPKASAWYEVKQAETELEKHAAFRAVKKYDEKVYYAMIEDIRQVVLKGESREKAMLAARAHMQELILRRLPTASNESVAEYMDVTMAELDVLEKKGGDYCFRFLFPQKDAPLDISKMLSQRMQTQDLEALAKVIETSATNPQPLPDAEEIEPRLQPIYAHLMEEYGEEVQLLANPAAVKAEADKRKVCAIVGSMYDRILALPAQESGRMLRFMLKST
jgi:hypothetical protein